MYKVAQKNTVLNTMVKINGSTDLNKIHVSSVEQITCPPVARPV
jgi:hypothetical protein